MRLGLEHDARHRRRLQQVVEALHAADVAHEERDSIAQGEVAAIEVRDGGGRPMRTAKIHVVWIVEGPHTLPARGIRSEEHTSELQSHSDLVCRLLLEKK